MVNVFIIGAGRGGISVLNRLLKFNWIQIIGVADFDPEAPAIQIAREANLPIFLGNPFCALQNQAIDLVFDLTGSPQVGKKLLSL
jgi:predicted homoserine dehydrogenase-like protein